MIFQFSALWCLAFSLLVSQTPVQGNLKETTHSLAKRIKRDEASALGNDFTEQNPYLQLGSQNAWPIEDLTKSENLQTLFRPNVFGKQNGYRDLSLLQPSAQYEAGNMWSNPRENKPRIRYFQKRDPEIDANDRPELNQLETDDEDIDDIDLIRRRAPRFSHNFIGKRQQSGTGNYNLWKRKGSQYFARRAPHFTHSFVGKRSDTGAGYGSNGISTGFPEGLPLTYPYSFMGTGSSSWVPLNKHFLGGGNFDNFKSKLPLQFSDLPSVHYLVKRASDMEKRGPSFGHSFVGKRAPRFGHSFVGKRAPRFGHSFVGKREEDDAEIIEKALLNNELEDELNYPLVPEEVVDQNDAGFEADYSEDNDMSAVKRQQRPSQNPSTFMGKRPSFTHSFVGKRAPGFGHSFVGKRAPGFGHSFVGKRAPGFGHSFVGKRDKGFGHSFVGKRAPGFGHSFVGKRAPGFGHSFVGKRAPGFGHSFVGKRAPGFGHSFVGKRAPGFGHSFVGKRAPGFGHSFVGKRPGFSHSFVGKRDEDADYILSEDPEDNFEFDSNKQENEESGSGDTMPELTLAAAEENVTDVTPLKETVKEPQADPPRNSSPDAVQNQEISPDMDKRAPRFGHSFVGKRAPGFGHSFVGKRAPGFGHSFVGKRAPRFGHSFVGKRAPAFGHSFVGKRAPRFGHSFVGKRAPRFGHSFVGKRAPEFGHSFVGKRDDLTSVNQGNLVEASLTPGDAVELVDLFQTDGIVKDHSGDAAYNDNSSKTSNV